MASNGGYDGSLRFNTKIDEAGFLRSIGDLQSAVGMLERALDRMASAMHGDMNAAAESAEQAADSVKAAARNVDAIPDTVSVAVNVQADGISETVSALDSIPDEEIKIIPDMVMLDEAVSIPAKIDADDVDTTEFQSAYESAIDKVKTKFQSLREKIGSLSGRMSQPSEQIGNTIGDGISRGIEQANPLGSLRSMLKRAAGLAASYFGIRALVSFGRQAVELASDIDEVQNVVDTAFGDMAYKIEDFAAASVEQFGISRLTAKQTGSTYMAMARGMGVASDSASDMAVSLTGLSADFASFYNVEQEAAAAALNSVFTGETETLKKFGIVMTETNLQQFALTQGIQKSVSAMTQAEKVQLRYAYVMNQGSLAVGDFAKTAGGWANQIRILQEQWKAFASQVGVLLKNVFLPIVVRINAALSRLTALTQSAVSYLADLFGWDLQAGSAAGAVQTVADSYDAVTDAAETAADAMDKTLSSYDELHKLGDSDAGTAAQGIGTGGGAAAAISSPYAANAQDGGGAPDTLAAKWKSKGQPVIDAIRTSWAQVKSLVDAVRDSFAVCFADGTASRTLVLLISILSNIILTVGNLAGAFAKAWRENDTGTKILHDIWGIINDILGLVGGLTASFAAWADETDFSPLLNSFEKLTGAIGFLTGDAASALQWFFDNVLVPVMSWSVESALPPVLDAISAAILLLHKIWKRCSPYLYDILWEKLLKPLAKWTADKAEKALTAIGDALKYIADNFDEADAVALMTAASAIAAVIAATKGYAVIKSAKDAILGLSGALAKPVAMGGGTITAALLAFVGAYEATKAILDHFDLDPQKLGEALYGAFHNENGEFSLGVWWENWKSGAHIDDWFADLANTLSGYWNAYIENWGTGWESIKQSASETWGELRSDLQTGWDAIGDKVSEWKDNWVSGADTIKTSVSDTWDNVQTALKSGWNEIGDKVSGWKDNWVSGAETIKTTASQKWKDLKSTLGSGWDTVKSHVSDWKQHWDTKSEEIRKKASEKWDTVKGCLSDGWDGIKRGVSDFREHWAAKMTSIKELASEKWDNIKSTLTSTEAWQKITGKLGEWRQSWDDSMDGVKKKVTGFKDDVVGIFSQIWSGSDGSGGIKGGINKLLGGIESCINAVIQGINWVVSGLNSALSFSLPDWLPVCGGKSFGLNLPQVNYAHLPRLATGTVVPANFGEFAAILGDNKREPEVVSPLSTIKQALSEVLGEKTDTAQIMPITIQLVCDGKKLAEVLARYDVRAGRITNGGAVR